MKLHPIGSPDGKSHIKGKRDQANKWRADMSRKPMASMMAIVVCLGIFVAAPAMAQLSTGPNWGGNVTQHHRMQYQMMKDMAEEMTRMTEQMSQGELTSEQRKQMAGRMALMSTMMQRMSGLAARPAMREQEWQKQMGGMRKQMDEMMRESMMMPGAK
jgi:hypothetical protein